MILIHEVNRFTHYNIDYLQLCQAEGLKGG